MPSPSGSVIVTHFQPFIQLQFTLGELSYMIGDNSVNKTNQRSVPKIEAHMRACTHTHTPHDITPHQTIHSRKNQDKSKENPESWGGKKVNREQKGLQIDCNRTDA